MKALDTDIDADNSSAQVHHVTVNTNSIQFDGRRIYPANTANCHHPGVIAIQGLHDGSGGCADNPRIPARPRRCPQRALTAADQTSEPGSCRQDGGRGCALPGAGGRAMTSGTPNTLFPPSVEKYPGCPRSSYRRGKASVSVWILVTPLKSVTCGSTQKVTSVRRVEHMAAVDLTTPGCLYFFSWKPCWAHTRPAAGS